MKKNLMSVLILALVLVNLVLTAILTITILPQTKKANELINTVCSAINLELQSGENTGTANVPIDQVATYTIPDSMTLNLKPGADGKEHIAVLSVSISMDTENEDYKTYGTDEKIAGNVTIIKDTINTVILQYTMEEFNANGRQDVKDEILSELKAKFNSDFIIAVNFFDVTVQ